MKRTEPKGKSMKLLTLAQVAEKLAISKTTLWRMRRDDQLPEPVKVRGQIRYRETDIEAAFGA
jgi:predicted DNA-binding transcriptional regulator AlpA